MDMITVSAKTVDEAVTKALIELETTSDKLEYEVVERGSAGFLGIGAKPAVIRAKRKERVEDRAIHFLNQVFDSMNMEVSITAVYNAEEKEMNINMEGTDMGILIGKRGQTLDSLQYLVSLVVNKKKDDYIRVKLDTENYRERRKETLETLAKNIAYKVKRTRRPASLEPMNPYERRVIHSALQNDKYVTTHSESAAHPLLHRAHEELPDQRENGQRQDPGEQKAHQGRGLFRHDVGEFDPLLIEAVNQPGVVRHLSGHVEIRLLGIFLIGDRIVDVPVIEICLGDLARLHVAHEGAIINLGDPRLQQQREDEDVEQHHDQHDHDDII